MSWKEAAVLSDVVILPVTPISSRNLEVKAAIISKLIVTHVVALLHAFLPKLRKRLFNFNRSHDVRAVRTFRMFVSGRRKLARISAKAGVLCSISFRLLLRSSSFYSPWHLEGIRMSGAIPKLHEFILE